MSLYEQETIKLPLGDKTIILRFREFDTDIDIDQLTSIDYSNLHGEIVTVSALLNKVGILKAQIDNHYADLELDYNILRAKRRKYHRANWTEDIKISVGALEDVLTLDQQVIDFQKAMLLTKKTVDIVNSWYWGIQSKDRKLSVLMKGVTPEEFAKEITEGVINEILIKKVDNLIKE